MDRGGAVVLVPELRVAAEEGLFPEAVHRLRLGPALLRHHGVKRLVHVDSKLDRTGADIKLPAGSRVRTTLSLIAHYSYLSGVEFNPVLCLVKT